MSLSKKEVSGGLKSSSVINGSENEFQLFQEWIGREQVTNFEEFFFYKLNYEEGEKAEVERNKNRYFLKLRYECIFNIL